MTRPFPFNLLCVCGLILSMGLTAQADVFIEQLGNNVEPVAKPFNY